MDAQAKKTALRMIPYGIYVLTARTPEGAVVAASVTWVTQSSFEPPIVAVAIRGDTRPNAVVRASRAFALNFLAKEQAEVAVTFFKGQPVEGDSIGGQRYAAGATGSPILAEASAWLDCRVVEVVERGDHHLFLGEVVDAGVAREPAGRPDEATLTTRDINPRLFYGG